MIVLDASAAAELLLERGPKADWVAALVLDAERIHAPHLIDVEVASVLRRRTLRKELPASHGEAALRELAHLPLTRYPIAWMLARIWALRERLTAYDAAYVALAESLGVPLVTADRRLGRSTGHRAQIVAYPG